MIYLKLSVWQAFFGLICFLLLSPGLVLAKSYTIPNVAIQAHLQSDGSAKFIETRAFDFDGDFSFAFRSLPISGSQAVSTVTLSDESGTIYKNTPTEQTTPGTFHYTTAKGDFYIKWFYSAHNQTKTFTISYTIANVARRHSDVGEFYWKLIGPDWDLDQSNITPRAFLPQQVPYKQRYSLA